MNSKAPWAMQLLLLLLLLQVRLIRLALRLFRSTLEAAVFRHSALCLMLAKPCNFQFGCHFSKIIHDSERL